MILGGCSGQFFFGGGDVTSPEDNYYHAHSLFPQPSGLLPIGPSLCVIPLSLMSSWTFERSILLNKQNIPMEEVRLSIIDPHDLGGSMGLNVDEDLDVNLVSFEAAANV